MLERPILCFNKIAEKWRHSWIFVKRNNSVLLTFSLYFMFPFVRYSFNVNALLTFEMIRENIQIISFNIQEIFFLFLFLISEEIIKKNNHLLLTSIKKSIEAFLIHLGWKEFPVAYIFSSDIISLKFEWFYVTMGKHFRHISAYILCFSQVNKYILDIHRVCLKHKT